MKPITIDPQLQSVLEHLNAARRDFSEAYTRITNEGAKTTLPCLGISWPIWKVPLVRHHVWSLPR